MKLLKPSWVHLQGKAIFAIDIHPDGSKFATGGQGEDCGLIVLWNMSPVRYETEEKDESTPRVLCQMDNHSGCVNCLRWSYNGQYLASGSDDKCVMIWQCQRSKYDDSSTSTSQNWRCAFVLRGHSEDVLDVSWSPDDKLLASGSVDNSIIIWNANSFPEILHTLNNHRGLVKGVTWDPVGLYFASQSDDKSLCIWRTSDWQPEHKITEPFTECSGTTHVLRLDWSTDGQYLVSAHAMNKGGPVAKIVNRDGWNAKMDFVGHRKAVTCVRFNKCLFTKSTQTPSSTIKQYSCCAIGSKDRSLSVWLTTLKRPLVVTHGLFKSSIMDISWSSCGSILLACSLDGTIAFLEFEANELGDPISEEEKFVYHKKAHGTNIKSGKASFASSFVENPDMLNIKPKSSITSITSPTRVSAPDSVFGGVTPGKDSGTKKNKTPSFSGEGFGVRQLSFTTATSEERKAALEILKQQKETITENGKRRITPLSFSLARDSQLVKSNISSIVEEPKAPKNSTSMKKTTHSQPLQTQSTGFTVKRKHDGVSSSEKKRGRKEKEKTKDKTDKTDLSKKSIDDDGRNLADANEAGTMADKGNSLCIPYPKPETKLCIKIPREGHNEKETVIEVENLLSQAVKGAHFLRCSEGDHVTWEVVVMAPITLIAVSCFVVAAACSDHTIHIFSRKGSRIFPPMLMENPISYLECYKHYIVAVMSSGHLSMWSSFDHAIVIKHQSISSILKDGQANVNKVLVTEKGCPVVCLSDGSVFSFLSNLDSWVPLNYCVSPLQSAMDFQPVDDCASVSGILKSVHNSTQGFSRQSSWSLQMNSSRQQSATISQIQLHLLAAKEVGSQTEYRHWLQVYTRHLIHGGCEGMLRDLCSDLFRPSSRTTSSSSRSVSGCLNHQNRSLLQDVLSVIGSNLQFQRLYAEYKDLLDTVK